MKLSDLKKRCEELNVQYSYGKFTKSTDPPHLVGRIIDTNNFSADNKVWFKMPSFLLSVTTLKKDLELEKLIEEKLLNETYWNKTEGENSLEGVYNISYIFKIEEE